ncbi:PilW family protein [Gloeobacter morelensis]|uniref:Prepilin-type N-terminal cleavage/methylation domain-containing protein n=1 Tax=Gloeobacter morelensis MG652769 TaxID=2781736 RepID=A0ABY3PFZ2_9CYAN|nr:prepilin-type N-terminal cleavage/methylation domain-containing protein [Gloeobacter morelensis]UFP92571.1 prepilin-type N-terminal cleavage/methylation domain-containing protein [Gloeobacter morelensis MG652769]
MRNRRGLTLLELLIAAVIGLLLVGAVTYTFTSFGKNALVENAVSDVQMDLHSALGLMTDELRQARYIYNTDPESSATDRLRLEPVSPTLATEETTLASANFDKSRLVQANSPGFRILLAFWVPTVAGTGRLGERASPAGRGTPLAFNLDSGALTAWGSANSIPAYNLIVYYVTDPPPGSAWNGPRILERWESEPVPIRYDEFAQAENSTRFLDLATFDATAAPPVDGVFLRNLPPADGASFALADFLDADKGIEVRYLSAQTVQISLRGSLAGSQADRYLAATDSTAQTYLRENAGDALDFTTTVVARNVCTANAICVKDP